LPLKGWITKVIIRLENQPYCLLCGKEGKLLYSQLSDNLFSVEGKWNIFTCTDCGLLWLNPRPIKDDIGKLYTNYHTHQVASKTRIGGSLKEGVRKSILRSVYGYPVGRSRFFWLGILLSPLPLVQDTVGAKIMMLDYKLRGKLLDVGAGSGEFLKNMQELGWDVSGIDPDPYAAAVAQNAYGISILPQTLDNTSLPDESFDVITLDHVIEHLPDPHESLLKINRLLKPGGLIVVMTPNLDSLGHRRYKKSWLHLDPPRHLYLFQRDSLQKLIKSAEFNIIKSRSVSSSAWWVWIACHVIKTHGHMQAGTLTRNDLRLSMKIRGALFTIVEELTFENNAW